MGKFMLSTEQIRNAVDSNWSGQIKWLKAITSFKTQRGDEGACQNWIAQKLEVRGLDVDRFSIAEVPIKELAGYSPAEGIDYTEAVQVVGSLRSPTAEGRSLILQGHVDVVPVGPAELWTADPYGGEIRDGRLYARGAMDMKAGICAMIFALDALRSQGFLPASDVFVQTVTEEECTGNGALATLARGYEANACLIPEPSDMKFMRGSVGVTWFTLSVMGVPSHVAGIEHGTNAIISMTRLMTALEKYTTDLNERVKTHHWFSQLESPLKFNPGIISGGDWASSTPAWCTLECRIAVLPGLTLEQFREELEQVVSEACKQDPFLRENPAKVTWQGFQAEHYVLEPGTEAESVFEESHIACFGKPMEEILFTGVTDARFYGLYSGIPSFCFGPKGKGAHGTDEYVDLDSVKEVTVVIADFIQRWCGLRKIEGVL